MSKPPMSASWQVALHNLKLANPDPLTPPTPKKAQLSWLVHTTPLGAIRAIYPEIATYDSKKDLWTTPKALPLVSIPTFDTKYTFEPEDQPAWLQLTRVNPHFDKQLPILDFLDFLVGHPRVRFFDQPGRCVPIYRGVPRLQGLRVKSNAIFLADPPLRSIDPGLSAQEPHYPARTKKDRLAAEQLRATTLNKDTGELIQLSPEQIAALQSLPPILLVPSSDMDRFVVESQQLAHLFEIQIPSAHQPRDATYAELVAELTPDDSAQTLDVKIYARLPSGSKAPLASPPALVHAYVQGSHQSIWRNLVQEAEDAQEISAILTNPPLSPLHWQLDLTDSAQLVQAIQCVAHFQQHPRIQVLWPKNYQPWKTHSAGIPQLQISVARSSKSNWFQVSGSLTLSETSPDSPPVQIPLSHIDSSTKYIEIAPKQFVSIDNLLLEKLQALQAVAVPHHDELLLHPILAAKVNDTLSDLTQQPDPHNPACLLDRPACYKDPSLSQQIHTLAALQSTSATVPAALSAQLRPYQIAGFQWLVSRAQAQFGAVLADDMGLGKTLQTIALLVHQPGPHLIVAPASLIHNWHQEIERFAPTLQPRSVYTLKNQTLDNLSPSTVVIASYNLAMTHQARFRAPSWGVFAMDEAQNIKNPTTKRAQSLAHISAQFKLALSGTPIENNLTELWAVFHQVNPSLLGPFATYRETFVKPIESNYNKTRLQQLKAIIGPFILRRTKEKVLTELPPLTESIYEVLPPEDEQATLAQIQSEARNALASLSGSTGNALFITLQYLTRLRRAACDPRLIDPARSLPGAKVLAISELVTNLKANGHRALVFSQFTEFLQLINQDLQLKNISTLYLDGATPVPQRQTLVHQFQTGSSDAFLISLKAGGAGLNITAADYVIIADPWWNPAVEDQATARAYRMGQSKPVTVYRIVNTAPSSVEPKVLALHATKRTLAGLVLDADVSDPASFQQLNPNDLLKALGLAP